MLTFTEMNYTKIISMVPLMVMFSLTTNHIINNLILIEYMVIFLILLITELLKHMNMEMYILMFVLVMMILESIIGLSLMINLVRTHGNDFMKSSLVVKS